MKAIGCRAGKLYDPASRLIAGLKPAHFVTLATPHMGCDGEGPAQVGANVHTDRQRHMHTGTLFGSPVTCLVRLDFWSVHDPCLLTAVMLVEHGRV